MADAAESCGIGTTSCRLAAALVHQPLHGSSDPPSGGPRAAWPSADEAPQGRRRAHAHNDASRFDPPRLPPHAGLFHTRSTPPPHVPLLNIFLCPSPLPATTAPLPATAPPCGPTLATLLCPALPRSARSFPPPPPPPRPFSSFFISARSRVEHVLSHSRRRRHPICAWQHGGPRGPVGPRPCIA